MRKSTVLPALLAIALLIALVISTVGLQGPSAPPAGTPADSITREELRDHVHFLPRTSSAGAGRTIPASP